jgi:hypothetical protein
MPRLRGGIESTIETAALANLRRLQCYAVSRRGALCTVKFIVGVLRIPDKRHAGGARRRLFEHFQPLGGEFAELGAGEVLPGRHCSRPDGSPAAGASARITERTGGR